LSLVLENSAYNCWSSLLIN